MNLFNRIREQAELAMAYLDDGAPHSAARVLGDLAEEVRKHAEQSDRLVAAFLAGDDPVNLAGSGPVPIEPRDGA
jgi:hypothetical protein